MIGNITKNGLHIMINVQYWILRGTEQVRWWKSVQPENSRDDRREYFRNAGAVKLGMLSSLACLNGYNVGWPFKRSKYLIVID